MRSRILFDTTAVSYTHLYFYFVAGILAYELILERIDEGMGTDLKRMILTLAALKCNAINKSLEVDHCGIAVCDRSVCNGNSSCVVISLFLYCCLYLFVRYGGCLLYTSRCV